MKRIILFSAVIISLAACKMNDKKDTVPVLSKEEIDKAMVDTSNFTNIQWLDSTYREAGKIKKGETKEISFRFKNTGNKKLIIADVTSYCGCTIAEKPGQQYSPDDEGVIKVRFDSKDQSTGEHTKRIWVNTNTNSTNPIALDFRIIVME